MFNQLVRSCAQLFVEQAEELFVPSEQAKNPVIEIPTVKWKEGGLLVRQGLPAVYHRVVSRPLGIRERLLQTRVLFFFFFFFLNNFVATPLRLFLKEKGNRLSPSGFPRGPAYVN